MNIGDTNTRDILIELIEIYINAILYTRDVYPKEIFQKQKVYNSPVFISTYTPLNEYILKLLRSVKELNDNKDLHQLELILYKNDSVTYERYIFEVDDKNPIVYEALSENDNFLIDFEEEIRKSLLNLSSRLKVLEKLPEDAKFKIFLHTTQSAFIKMSNKSSMQDFPWVQKSAASEDFLKPEKLSILPITALKSTGLQLYAEHI